ncbi:hypothetical protein EMIHUDRAFT_444126 [Emiliania huxleyi CCMP1516]|uniref:UDP-glucose 6-dehydrogenase n=2 Tax=Emiliania huxleyi TaxID=2903 RepID=A0A0D3JIS1_EMIH1|nr:hypothetical protein EMIHUDRAFT_444126 [Emiliania huxleyi CCMP1516]EOD23406.1 hypothetical protein EMIHUDRAFT_444126 [Emiliania huxleyi CCMP1516]|eukprot:XP_005775835.1 hypothetical protein EMIHUDRAFT_444126 [Emiliania huxleyi CCMP1516]
MAPVKSICVIGAGHVGVPHAVTVASKCPDIRVTVVDDDARKIKAWGSARLPFFEPGMQPTLEEVRGVNLFFSTDIAAAIAEADMVLVSVSTPVKETGANAGYAPDLQHWEAIARKIAAASRTPKIIVERSTVPVATADTMTAVIRANSTVERSSLSTGEWVVLSNPEFAQQGNAMLCQASPERVMIGVAEGDKHAEEAARALAAIYERWVPKSRILLSDLWSAELSKMVADAFLAQRISSINSISALCERTGADVSEVSHAIGVDTRIGRKYLQASVGFGGACYETHLRNLVYLCKHYRLPQVGTYWESVLKMNDYQKRRFAANIVGKMFNTISNKKLAVLGFAYKKNTSDTRHTVAIDVCNYLLAERARLSIHDPRVAAEAIGIHFSGGGLDQLVNVETDPYAACDGAHALILLTEWDMYLELDFEKVYETMSRPAHIFDGRNLLDHDKLREIGFLVEGVGKGSPPSDE